MRTALFAAITAAAALVAGQGAAHDHSAHHADQAAPAGHSMEGMDPAAQHKMCESVMGKAMQPKAVHEHSREKSGIAVWPNGKPLTKDEMAKMHERCAAMMAKPAAETPKN